MSNETKDELLHLALIIYRYVHIILQHKYSIYAL